MREVIVNGGSSAYDLDKFQPRQKARKKPRLTVKHPEKRARAQAHLLFTMKASAFVAVIVASVVAMLYSNAVLTELTRDISVQTATLEKEKNEYTRLTAELEAKVSLRNVEEYATQKLGMVPVDKSQVIYIELNEGDKIELTSASPKKSFFDEIRLAVNRMKEYIGDDENTHIEQQDKQEAQ